MRKDLSDITKAIDKYKAAGGSLDKLSDGYHTFEELYYHRMILFLVVQKAFINKAWKSKQHHDGTMFDNYFITGIETPEGQYSYHYHLKYWDLFKDIPELDKAPEWDGHKPEDIDRLLSFFDYHRYRGEPISNSPLIGLTKDIAKSTEKPVININIPGETRDIDTIYKDVVKTIDENLRNTMFNSFTID